MNNVFMYSHNPNSESAIMLSRHLGIKRIAHKNSRFVPSPDKTIINWGSSAIPEKYHECRIINKPADVGIFVDKVKTFQFLDNLLGVNTVPWTQDIDVAVDWLDMGYPVVERHVINGTNGEGIVFVEPTNDDEPNAVDETVELFTRYVKKKSEYRLHFVNQLLIKTQKKIRVKDFPEDRINWRVRNLANGFIYQGIEHGIPDQVIGNAKALARQIPLDFFAVDIIYNERSDRSFILEVNTAPGLSADTCEQYANYIHHMYLR